MKHYDWKTITPKEGGDYDRPTPGAYIARIVAVSDVEEKEYLKVEWDFAEGQYKDSNQETFLRAGFWPIPMFRSYKESAIGMFKHFVDCVEASNPGYQFDDRDPYTLLHKLVGIVLGEEGYLSNRGEHKTRLYIAQVRSLEQIRRGDFKVPDYRENTKGGSGSPRPSGVSSYTPPPAVDDGPLPWE